MGTSGAVGAILAELVRFLAVILYMIVVLYGPLLSYV